MRDALVFVKLGGSILTDKTRPEAIDHDTLRSVATTLSAALRDDDRLRVLIGHGGGSFGHYWAERYGTHRGAYDSRGWEGVARVADAMGRLNRLVVAALLESGIQAIGVQPSASAIAEGGELRELTTHAITLMLDARLTPVVYGDVVLDRAQGAAIASTEAIFGYLAPRLMPQRIVLLGERGVFTADPRRDSQALRIPRIDSRNIAAVLAQTGASHGTDVTGGMAGKVRQMWRLAEQSPGLSIYLVGTEPEVVCAAVRGEAVDEGTVIQQG
jgi:isopentenyl phosphate kinase